MSRILAILFLFVPFCFLSAQDLDSKYFASEVEVEYSPVKKLKFSYYSDELIGYDNNMGYYLLEMKKRPTAMNMEGVKIVRYYNSNHELIHEYPVVPNKEEKLVRYEGFHHYDGKSYILTSQRLNKEKKNSFRVTEIKNGNSEPTKELFKAGFGSNEKANSRRIASSSSYFKSIFHAQSGDKFTSISSRDNSKLFIFKNETNYSYGAQDKIEHYTYAMLDAKEGMKLLWKHNIDMPYESSYFELLDGCVDQKGNLYLLGVVFTDKKKNSDSDGRPNYEFKVFKYNQDGQVYNSTIKLDNKFVTDMKIDLASNGTLVASGFYSDNKSTTSVDQYFVENFGINKKGENY